MNHVFIQLLVQLEKRFYHLLLGHGLYQKADSMNSMMIIEFGGELIKKVDQWLKNFFLMLEEESPLRLGGLENLLMIIKLQNMNQKKFTLGILLLHLNPKNFFNASSTSPPTPAILSLIPSPVAAQPAQSPIKWDGVDYGRAGRALPHPHYSPPAKSH